MKSLYARFVLWLISPALALRSDRMHEKYLVVSAEFARGNPPTKLGGDILN
ncbi:hypothetical protein [Burkholderia gladioli]|uniref:hypothetical protein n=1 Tax=Burkholderia gladioli TaxID=28095 RepID=UPI00163E70D9|nr:hypothetical protein [Burkholderia gladioli]